MPGEAATAATADPGEGEGWGKAATAAAADLALALRQLAAVLAGHPRLRRLDGARLQPAPAAHAQVRYSLRRPPMHRCATAYRCATACSRLTHQAGLLNACPCGVSSILPLRLPHGRGCSMAEAVAWQRLQRGRGCSMTEAVAVLWPAPPCPLPPCHIPPRPCPLLPCRSGCPTTAGRAGRWRR